MITPERFKDVLWATSQVLGVPVHCLTSRQKMKRVYEARQAVYWILNVLDGESQCEIARAFGRKGWQDHGPIGHGVHRHQKRIENPNQVWSRLTAAIIAEVGTISCSDFAALVIRGRFADWMDPKPGDKCVRPNCGRLRSEHRDSIDPAATTMEATTDARPKGNLRSVA